MDRTLQFVLLGLLALFFGLAALARRFPRVAWLRVFRDAVPRLSDEQRAKGRRRTDIYAGIELILMGIVLPMAYVALTVMFFNEFTATGIALVAVASSVLILLGGIAIWRNRRAPLSERRGPARERKVPPWPTG